MKLKVDREIVVAGAVRTPIGRFGGALAGLSAVELGVVAARAALERAGVPATAVGETVFGHGRQAGSGPNPARQVAVRAGVPETSPALTVNKACASSLVALVQAARAILLGEIDVALVGGMESMSRTPYLIDDARWGLRLGHRPLLDGMYRDGFDCPLAGQVMGATAENLARRYSISREEQDAYAARSQQRCQAAREAGLFAEEIVPVEAPGRKGVSVRVDADEHPRDGVTAAALSRLPPVFDENGTVHAGNSSGITDGAAALVVLSGEAARRHGVSPDARIGGWGVAGVDPRIMGIGPVPALRELEAATGVSHGDVQRIELNEAFAAQVLACDRDLGLDHERLNVRGGAIALGHPIGATGARITVTLLHEMRRSGAHRGIATLCVSGGQGVAVLFERAGG